MSAIAAPVKRPSAGARRPAAPVRPAVRLTAFAALAAFGAIRWAALLDPAPVPRMLGLVAVATGTVAAISALSRRGRGAILLVLAVVVAAAVVSLALAGVPVRMLVHLRVAAVAEGIGNGLAGLPSALVPLRGADHWVRTAIMLGGAVLLLDAAVVLAFAPGALGDAVRAGAALPLIALAAVPFTLVRPAHPYLLGAVLLALIAALVWGERLHRAQLLAGGAALLAAGTVAVGLAAAMNPGRAWIDYQAIAGSLAPAGGERFDWTQHYGPLDWPRTGRAILAVRARRADYWKTENLDAFDGVHWIQASIGSAGSVPPPDAAQVARWSQTITVSLRAVRTTDVIGSGDAARPVGTGTPVLPGVSNGTWVAASELGPGDSYSLGTYSPHPSAAELSRVGNPGTLLDGLDPYRSIRLPAAGAAAEPLVEFAPFGSGPAGRLSVDEEQLIRSSPYAGAYALATSLAAGAAGEEAFVERVLAYLQQGFTYSESPPSGPYPLERFLFVDHRGYCQQFAGSMALLLRMGGVPARVAVGFTQGTPDESGQFVVTDYDAHAWVEVWFPTYGWVRFDPTPASAPELATIAPLTTSGPRGLQPIRHAGGVPDPATLPGARRSGRPAGGSVSPAAVAGVVAGLALAAIASLWALGLRGAQDPERLVAELARALRRTGRDAGAGLTLAELEHRFRDSPAAAAYIRRLRLARYAGAASPPHPGGRRALRGCLAAGLGPAGWLRALWALPPRPAFSAWRRALHRLSD